MGSRRFGPLWPFKKKAPKPPRYRRHREDHNRDRYDWITLWTAIAGVFIVAVSTGITAWQAYLTRQELNTLIAQDRAWLQLDPQVKTGLGVYSRGAFVGVTLQVKNVGTMPAYRAWGFMRLYPMPASSEVSPPYGWSDDICPKPERYIAGATVFPGEVVDVFVSPVMPVRAEIDTVEDSKQEVEFVLLVCVQYETAEQPVPRQTGAAYMVHRVDAEGRVLAEYNARDDFIPLAKDIRLVRLGVGDIAN